VDEIRGRNKQRMKVYKGMFRTWNPTKEHIETWLKTKELEFA
jgi:hypothetical protein